MHGTCAATFRAVREKSALVIGNARVRDQDTSKCSNSAKTGAKKQDIRVGCGVTSRPDGPQGRCGWHLFSSELRSRTVAPVGVDASEASARVVAVLERTFVFPVHAHALSDPPQPAAGQKGPTCQIRQPSPRCTPSTVRLANDHQAIYRKHSGVRSTPSRPIGATNATRRRRGLRDGRSACSRWRDSRSSMAVFLGRTTGDPRVEARSTCLPNGFETNVALIGAEVLTITSAAASPVSTVTTLHRSSPRGSDTFATTSSFSAPMRARRE